MSRLDDVIQAATYRLRPDAELQRDIAQELRAHLADTIAAARAVGMDEAQAEQSALEAFGDPEEVGQRLWKANLQRMRLRAIAKWTARLVLMPAGILVAVWLCSTTLELLVMRHWLNALGVQVTPWGYLDSLENRIERYYAGKISERDDITKEEYLLLKATGFTYSGPSVSSFSVFVPRWKQLSERYPDNPHYLARYFIYFCSYEVSINEPLLPAHQDLFKNALEILNTGEKMDPNNAFWNYMKARLLMYGTGAATLEENESFTFVGSRSSVKPPHGWRLKFADRALFEEGIEEYRKGLTKQTYRSYVSETQETAMAALVPARTISETLHQTAVSDNQVSFDLVTLRGMVRGVMAYSALLIQEGRQEEAAELIKTAPVSGAQLGGNSRTVIELLVASAMRQNALRQGAALYDRMGQKEMATKALAIAREESQDEGKFLQRPTADYDRFLREHGGISGSFMFKAVPLSDLNIVLLQQRAERFFVERLALALLAVPYALIVGYIGLWTLLQIWWHRKDTSGPRLYFIGWRRIGWIALVGVILPLAAYAIFTHAFSFGSANYGVNYMPGRFWAEIGATLFLVICLPLLLGLRAARVRCREAGIKDPKELWMSARRSLLPVLVVCFILIGVVSQAYCRFGEARAIQYLNQPGHRPFVDEMEYVTWKDYRAYLKNLPEHGAL